MQATQCDGGGRGRGEGEATLCRPGQPQAYKFKCKAMMTIMHHLVSCRNSRQGREDSETAAGCEQDRPQHESQYEKCL